MNARLDEEQEAVRTLEPPVDARDHRTGAQFYEPVERALALLRRGARRRKAWLWRSLGIYVGVILSIVLLQTSALLRYPAMSLLLWPAFAVAQLMVSIVYGTAACYLNLRLTRGEREAAQALAACDDARCLGPLLDASGIADKRTRAAMINGIILTLDRVTPSDADQLTDRTLLSIYSLLRRHDDRLFQNWAMGRELDVVVSGLHAIGQVGDVRAINRVRELAEVEATGVASERVCAAARVCLPLLERRIASQAARADLLVPASVERQVDVSLLTPASGPGSESSEILLRPSAEHVPAS